MDAEILTKSLTQGEELGEKKLAEERAKKRTSQKRWRQRAKLKIRVAEFIRKLHMQRARTFEKGELVSINTELSRVTRLPYCWNDKDLLRANAALSALEKKYLDRAYVKLNQEEAEMTAFLKNTLESGKLTNAQKVNVALSLLTDVGRTFVIEAGEGLTPSPDAALVLMTQDLGGTVPQWFAQSLADLLEQHFTRLDIKHFLLELNNVLKKRDQEKYAASDRVKAEEEEYAEFVAATSSIDANAFLSATGAKVKK